MNQTPHLPRLKWTRDLQNLLLALSLVLTLLVFWGPPLLSSLERPSVQGVLEQRQLELQALASQAVVKENFIILSPDQNAPLLSRQLLGADALRELAAVLQQRQDNATTTDRDLRLRQVLVLLAMDQPEQSSPLLESLRSAQGQGQGESSAAIILQQALVQRAVGDQVTAAELEGLGDEALEDALPHHPLYQSLACSVLDLDRPFCAGSHAGALVRLALVSLVGPLAAGVGILLWLVQLGRFLWPWKRSPLPPSPPPATPPLTIPALLLFFFGGVVVLGNGAGALALLALRPWVQASSSAGQAMATMVVYGAQALPGLAVLRWLRGREGQSGWQWLQLQWGLGWRSFPMALGGLLLSLPLVLLASWGVSQLFPDAGGSNPLLDLVLNSRDRTALVFFALTACLLAPLYEELVFRATILPVMARSYGAGVGVLLSSLLFAAAHLSLVEFFPLLILGLGLGWLRLRSGRLSACVLMHAAWNGYTLANLMLLSL